MIPPESWEPSAWLRHAIARRQMTIDTVARPFGQGSDGLAVVMPVSPWSEPGSREDRSCDRCGVYVPVGHTLWLGGIELRRRDGLTAVVTFGLCTSCGHAEGWTES